MQNVNTQTDNLNANASQAPIDLPIALTDESREILVPLRKLVASPYNQRKIRSQQAITAMADNILAINLLHNLVVHPMRVAAKKAQTFGVDAGETRRLALLLNVERGHITLDFQVRCLLISEADAILVSAAENDIRTPAHPADQFLAFKALADQGRSPEFIGAVFNVSPKTVAGRLNIANVSPKLFDLFAKDMIELQQIQVLAMVSDHARQEAVWFGARYDWDRQPHSLRQRLKGDKLTLNDKTVKFVTLEAYENAGGIVERDLLAEDDEGFIVDRELLDKLVAEKISTTVDAVKSEGWVWVESRNNFDYSDQNKFVHLESDPVPLSTEQQAKYDSLQARIEEIDGLLEAHEQADEGDDGYLTSDKHEALESEYHDVTEAIEDMDNRDGQFSLEQMNVSGAIVYIGNNGNVEVKRGLVRMEDRAGARVVMESKGVELPRSMTKKVKGAHSEKLLLNLTAHRTVAVQSALAQNPHVALATLVHNLSLSYLYSRTASDLTAAMISRRDEFNSITKSAPGIEQTQHAIAFGEYKSTWQKLLPKHPNDLFGWLIEQSQDRLLSILALCTAISMNGVSRSESADPINAVAGALNLDISEYWKPTADSYFNHVSKDRIAAVISTAISPEEGQRLSKLKKREAAIEAEKLMADSGWLPEFMAEAEIYKTNRYYGGLDQDDENDDQDNNIADSTGDQAGLHDEESTEVDSIGCSTELKPTATKEQLLPVSAWPFPRHHDQIARFQPA